MSKRITLASLRWECPSVAWKAERLSTSLGWRYIGELPCGGMVTVVRCTDGWFAYRKGAGVRLDVFVDEMMGVTRV